MTDAIDTALVAWLREGPDVGPPEPLARALALTRTMTQRHPWLVRDRWPRRTARSGRLLAIAAALLLALAAGLVAIMSIGTPQPRPLPIGDDVIPLPADIAIDLPMLVNGWGYRLSDVPSDAASPRISAAEAVDIAGLELLHGLQTNGMPPQDPTRPDGLMRRQILVPETETPRVVWVVTYRWKVGFDCSSERGGPGACPHWETHMIDDQTGERVTSFSSG